MITDYENKALKIDLLVKKVIGVNKPGDIVKGVRVDKAGTPLDKDWRRRLKDSAIDGCVEIVKKEKPVIKTKKETDK